MRAIIIPEKTIEVVREYLKTGSMQVKIWLEVIIVIIAIVSSTIAIGQYLTVNPLLKQYDNVTARVDKLEKEYLVTIAKIETTQQNILEAINELKLKVK